MNIQLCNHPTAQEVWKSVCNLSADSAPSVDGFIGHFFRVVGILYKQLWLIWSKVFSPTTTFTHVLRLQLLL